MTQNGASPHNPDLIAQLRQSVRIEDVVGLRVRLIRRGREMIGLCPFHNDHHPSLKVRPLHGYYKCHACGAGGDAFSFLMRIDGLTFPETVAQLAAHYGLTDAGVAGKAPLARRLPPAPAVPDDGDDRDAERAIAQAVQMFRESVAAAGTLVEDYLTARALPPGRIDPGVLRQLRFLPRVPYWHTRKGARRATVIGEYPVMLAPFQNGAGHICGVHLTYLRPDGGGKMDVIDPDAPDKKLNAKKMKGRPWGCAIRLGAPAPVMVVSEGIENGLTSLVARPEWPVWVAGSLGNMAGAGIGEGLPHPIRADRRLPSVYPNFCKPGMMPPEQCRRVIILGERDAGDQPSAACLIERAARRFSQSGWATRIAWAPEGMDHNDVLRQRAAGGAA